MVEYQVVSNVAVPLSLIRAPSAFQGVVMDDCVFGDLHIRNGRIAGMSRPTANSTMSGIVIPRLTEPHVHLDKCFTISRITSAVDSFAAALTAQKNDKVNWTRSDIQMRAEKAMQELVTNGCGVARTHVDWTHGDAAYQAPFTWDTIGEIAQTYKYDIDLQLCALVSANDMVDYDQAKTIAAQIAKTKGALGLFVLDHADRTPAIENAFRVATEFGLSLDFHVDEGLHAGLDGLDIIAQTALNMGYQGPVLCGHACSLMNYQGEALDRLLDKLAQTSITIAAMPTTNLYLQGRNGGTPDRRGITRVHELITAGVSVICGTDNVADAFYPIGKFDPLLTLTHMVSATHLTPPFGRYLPMITTKAQEALGKEVIYLDNACSDQLNYYPANGLYELFPPSQRHVRLSELVKAA